MRTMSRVVVNLLVPAVFGAGLLQAAPPVSIQAAGGCSPASGRIIQQVCDTGSVDNDVLLFEDEIIADWLTTHEIPLIQSPLIYQYGRTDLRSELRSVMLLRLMEIANKPVRTAHETAVYNWFQNRVWMVEKAFWTKAVALRNQFLANPCTWQPDPEIAAQYSLAYSTPDYCTGTTLLSLFVTPELPTYQYFLAAAVKQTLSERLTDPSAAGVLEDVSVAYAVLVIGGGVAAVAAITVATVLTAVGATAFTALSTAAIVGVAFMSTCATPERDRT